MVPSAGILLITDILLLPGRASLTVRTTRLVSSEVEMYLMTQGGV
jgi:hypothetical protein